MFTQLHHKWLIRLTPNMPGRVLRACPGGDGGGSGEFIQLVPGPRRADLLLNPPSFYEYLKIQFHPVLTTTTQ